MLCSVPKTPFRIAALSDLHITGESSALPNGVDVRKKYREVLEFSRHLSPDCYIYVGDIAHAGEKSAPEAREAYQFVAQEIESITLPSLFVAGNHDDVRLMRELLQKSDVKFGSKQNMTYATTIGGVPFIVIDGNDTSLSGAQGRVSEEDLLFLQEMLEKADTKSVVAIHYPPLDMDSPWLRGEMLLVNGEDFHSVLCRNREKVALVLFGHIHRDAFMVNDGIPYLSVASSSFKFENGPNDSSVKISGGSDAYLHLITITERGVITKSYNVPTEYSDGEDSSKFYS